MTDRRLPVSHCVSEVSEARAGNAWHEPVSPRVASKTEDFQERCTLVQRGEGQAWGPSAPTVNALEESGQKTVED